MLLPISGSRTLPATCSAFGFFTISQTSSLWYAFASGWSSLVTPGDVGELVAAIAALLDDPERRTAMGAAGRARVEEMFSWRAVAEATAAAYEETIADFQEENHRADR